MKCPEQANLERQRIDSLVLWAGDVIRDKSVLNGTGLLFEVMKSDLNCSNGLVYLSTPRPTPLLESE